MNQQLPNQLCPEGWSKNDLSTASIEMERFRQSQAYAWLDNYMSHELQKKQKELVPSNPGDVPHGRFIAASASVAALDHFYKAVKYLATWKEPSDENQ